jgi:hypothetical protein
MKRSTTGREHDSMSTMANYLMLLSRGGEMDVFSNSRSPTRVFECKTCSRQFQSFQALGGHRASHKKPRLMGGDGSLDSQSSSSHGSPTKPKSHECSICGLEFAIGQALGGHMRRHRQNQAPPNLEENGHGQQVSQVPVVKKTTSRKVLYLDLNLTPFENDLGLAPPIYGWLFFVTNI